MVNQEYRYELSVCKGEGIKPTHGYNLFIIFHIDQLILKILKMLSLDIGSQGSNLIVRKVKKNISLVSCKYNLINAVKGRQMPPVHA